MILRANCKINLGLDVIRRREDGFHELVTAMLPVSGLFDELHIDISESVTFRSLGIEIDCPDSDNLCVKAARLMQQRYGVGGVAISLDKRIPFGAGLGGGSADATAVLLAINELYGLKLHEQELIDVAAELGSDTAFFVRNSPQLCRGRGEIMEPINIDTAGMWIALIKPRGVNISTREAFSGIKPAQPELSLSERLAKPRAEWQHCVKNDFEPHIFAAHPILAQIKSDLMTAGAIYASMSGSGSTVYGLFEGQPTKKESEQLDCYSPYIFEL